MTQMRLPGGDPVVDSTHSEIHGGIFFSAVVQGRNITVQLPPQITPALSGLPAGSPAFTGREDDLDAVLALLAPRSAEGGRGGGSAPAMGAAGRAVVVTAVGGLAGIGKTELAVQAAHAALARGWFPGGVLFVDLFGYDTARRLDPGQALEGLLRALGIPDEHVPPGVQDRARLYASVLAVYAQHGKRILVVADNASTHEQVLPLLPADGVTGAIITSRHTLGMLDARLLDLGVLSPPDAVELLQRALRAARPNDTRVIDHPGDATTIAELCGGLPLALRIVAALLADNPARPLAAMAADLADSTSRLQEMEYGDVAVRAAFDLSYRHLTSEQARLFRLLPVNPGPEVSTDAAAALAGLEPATARHLLEALARAHLIDHGSAYGRWRMHDLVRLFSDQYGRAHADADERAQALTAGLEYYLNGAQVASHALATTINPTGQFVRILSLSSDPHDLTRMVLSRDPTRALGWLDTEYSNLIATAHVAAREGRLTIARDLPLALTRFFAWRRHLDDWVVLGTLARDAARHLDDRDGEGAALISLTAALEEMERFDEAATAGQDAARIHHELGDRHGEGVALINLSIALQHLQRFDEAVIACQDAARIHHELGDRHGQATALASLGLLKHALERPGEAITAHQTAAQIFGGLGDRYSHAKVLINLAAALQDEERFDEAATACQKAAHLCHKLGDQYGEGVALLNLGTILQRRRQFDSAITTHQDAEQLFRDVGDRHKQAAALFGFGIDLQHLRRFDEAITAYRDAVQILTELGDEQAQADVLTNLGVALQELQRFDEAITACQDAARIYHDLGDSQAEQMTLGNLKAAQEALHPHERP